LIVVTGIPVFLQTGNSPQETFKKAAGIIKINYFSMEGVLSRELTSYLYSKSVA